MLDQLWDENPRVKKMKEQFREQTRKEVEQVRKEAIEQARKEAQQESDKKLAEWQEKIQGVIEKEKAYQEVKTRRSSLVSVVHARFPGLTEVAQQQVELFDKPDALDLLIQKIATAPDAKTARWLLDSSAEVQE